MGNLGLAGVGNAGTHWKPSSPIIFISAQSAEWPSDGRCYVDKCTVNLISGVHQLPMIFIR
jgi:hypothetical protein